MKIPKFILPVFCLLFLSISAFAQNTVSEQSFTGKRSPAYVVLAQHRASVFSELRNLQRMYTNRHSEIIDKQSELFITEIEMMKITMMPESQKEFLSEAFGKLVLSKITAENELERALRNFTPKHPTAIKAADKLRAIESEITDYTR